MPESVEQNDFWLPDLCNPLAFLRLTLLGVFITIVLTLLKEGIWGFMLAEVGRLFLYSVWIVFISATGLCQLRKWGKAWGVTQNKPVSVFHSSLLAISWLIISASFCAFIAYKFALQIFIDDQLSYFSIWSETTILTLIFGSLVLRFLYVHHELQRQQRQLMQAQYDALQARIRPHFLFNSLNSIATLVSVNARKAEDAILDLSDLLRATLGEKVEHSLADELAVCSKYLDIEALRMGERMVVNIDVEPELNKMLVPTLFLQPLLENSVIHGLQPLPEGGRIDLRIKRSEADRKRVQISVQNPLPTTKPLSKGAGSALANIEARLNQFYTQGVFFHTEASDGIFCIQIEVYWADE